MMGENHHQNITHQAGRCNRRYALCFARIIILLFTLQKMMIPPHMMRPHNTTESTVTYGTNRDGMGHIVNRKMGDGYHTEPPHPTRRDVAEMMCEECMQNQHTGRRTSLMSIQVMILLIILQTNFVPATTYGGPATKRSTMVWKPHGAEQWTPMRCPQPRTEPRIGWHGMERDRQSQRHATLTSYYTGCSRNSTPCCRQDTNARATRQPTTNPDIGRLGPVLNVQIFILLFTLQNTLPAEAGTGGSMVTFGAEAHIPSGTISWMTMRWPPTQKNPQTRGHGYDRAEMTHLHERMVILRAKHPRCRWSNLNPRRHDNKAQHMRTIGRHSNDSQHVKEASRRSDWKAHYHNRVKYNSKCRHCHVKHNMLCPKYCTKYVHEVVNGRYTPCLLDRICENGNIYNLSDELETLCVNIKDREGHVKKEVVPGIYWAKCEPPSYEPFRHAENRYFMRRIHCAQNMRKIAYLMNILGICEYDDDTNTLSYIVFFSIYPVTGHGSACSTTPMDAPATEHRKTDIPTTYGNFHCAIGNSAENNTPDGRYTIISLHDHAMSLIATEGNVIKNTVLWQVAEESMSNNYCMQTAKVKNYYCKTLGLETKLGYSYVDDKATEVNTEWPESQRRY